MICPLIQKVDRMVRIPPRIYEGIANTNSRLFHPNLLENPQMGLSDVGYGTGAVCSTAAFAPLCSAENCLPEIFTPRES